MPDFNRPVAYLDRLRFCERTVKSASFRHDKNLAMRELCEGVLFLIETLIAHEEGAGAKPDANEAPPEQSS